MRSKSISLAAIVVTAVGLFTPKTALTKPLRTVNDTIQWAVPNHIQPKDGCFPLQDVTLLPSPFKTAMQADERYLLILDPDRLLSMFFSQAGLKPKAPPYGGWEQLQVAGHTLGHYLSAISRMYVETHNPLFKQRVDYIVQQLAICQNKWGDGYIGAIPGGHAMFEQVKLHGIDPHHVLDNYWAPWYVIHKLLAGLLDSYRFCGSRQALAEAVKLGDWTDNTTRNLSPQEWQEMLSVEQGGMNEALANLYALTGSKRFLYVAREFYHKAIMDPLALGEDHLAGNHCNTQIPKVIGQARLFELRGRPSDKTIAETFWNASIYHHAYSIGDISSGEYFGPADKLAHTLAANTCETCCTYNLLKLTRHLFTWNPKAAYGDYMERALYNDILASQNPKTGMLVYYMPLLTNTARVYSTPFDSFWCCVGTGMENHARYPESIYFHTHNAIYANLYIPSVLHWHAQELTLTQQNHFPQTDSSLFTLHCSKPVRLTLYFRCPYWIAAPMQIQISGPGMHKKLVCSRPSSWAAVTAVWRTGDTIRVTMPMALHTDPMPDMHTRISLMYGPIVLAADLGSKTGPMRPAPYFLASKKPLSQWFAPVQNKPLTFRTTSNAKPGMFTLRPFYSLYEHRTAVYMDVLSPAQWQMKQQAAEAQKIARMQLQRLTLDQVQIGSAVSEKLHHLQGMQTNHGDAAGKRWRDASGGGWFSYTLRIVPNAKVALRCVYWGSDAGQRAFHILVNGVSIAECSLNQARPGKFFSVVYPIPLSLTQGKSSITVRFQADPGNFAGGIFGLRTLRSLKGYSHV